MFRLLFTTQYTCICHNISMICWAIIHLNGNSTSEEHLPNFQTKVSLLNAWKRPRMEGANCSPHLTNKLFVPKKYCILLIISSRFTIFTYEMDFWSDFPLWSGNTFLWVPSMTSHSGKQDHFLTLVPYLGMLAAPLANPLWMYDRWMSLSTYR